MRGARRLAAAAAGLCAAALVVLAAGAADARSGGISGASGRQGTTCAECHNGGTRPDVAFVVPEAIHAGETVTLRFTVHGTSPSARAAGLDVAVEGGTLGTIPGQDTHLSNGEITHNEPRANDDADTAGWDFKWIAPATPGRYRLWGAGNSVNLNGQTTGDRSNAIVLRVDVLAAADTPTPTATTAPATATAAATATPTASPTVVIDCPGDCNGDGTVTINELITAVSIALDTQPLTTCPVADPNGDQRVAINELITLVNNALNAC